MQSFVGDSSTAGALAPSQDLGQTVDAGERSKQTAPRTQTGSVVIRSVEVKGVTAVSSKKIAAAVAAVAVGRTGDTATIAKSTRAAIRLYRDRGYPVAQVADAEVTPEGVLRLTIAEGTIRRVIIRGNRKTRLSTIFRTLSLHPGDVYNETRARNDRNRLARLGIFDDVIISAQVPGTEGAEVEPISASSAKGDIGHLPPDLSQGTTPDDSTSKDNPAANPAEKLPSPAKTPPTAPTVEAVPIAGPNPDGKDDEVGQVDLVVRVKEHSTFNIAATVGYADAIGPVGFVALSELNAAGTAQRVDVVWQRISNSYLNSDGSISRQDSRQAFDLRYEKPALNVKATSFSVSLYDKNTVFLPYFAGQDQTFRTFEKRSGASARLGHAIGPNLTAYMTLRRADVAYDEFASYYSGPLPPQYLVDRSAAHIGAAGVEVVADGRDVIENPRKGYLHSLRYEDAGAILGGNRAFSQTTADLRSYTPVGTSVAGPVVAFRVLAGYTQGAAPLSEYYFLGGYELLRGYDLYSIFGDRTVLGTVELRARLSQGMQGVIFLDAGNAWLPGESIAVDEIKADGGFGIRFLSPIGPIRFDAAYGSSLKTYVTLGQSF